MVQFVVLEDTKDAVPLAKGSSVDLPCAEVTFRTEATKSASVSWQSSSRKCLWEQVPNLTTEQVDAAVGAEPKFIVSPGFDPKIVDCVWKKTFPVFPGCITPSEVAQAVKRGLKG